MTELHHGWLIKDGGMLGLAKKRYFVLSLAETAGTAHGKNLILDYYTDEDKATKKGTFLLSIECKFTKLDNNKFSLLLDLSSSKNRKDGSIIEFQALSEESYKLWESAFLLAENPLDTSKKGNTLMVIGSSGYVGLATIKCLSKYSKTFNILAGVRELDSTKNDALNLPGVTLIHANMNDKESMITSLNSVDCAFIVTPNDIERVTLVKNAIDACQEASISQMIILSIPSATVPNTVYGDQFNAIEDYAQKSKVAYTIVRLSMFMENILGHIESIAGLGEFSSPIPSFGVSHNSASVQDIAECVAMIMTDFKRYQGRILHLTGDLYCESDYATAFAEVMKKPVEHNQVGYDKTRKFAERLGMDSWQVDGWIELYQLIESGSSCLNSDQSDMKSILKRQLTTPKQLAYKVESTLHQIIDAYSTVAEKKRIAEKRFATETATKLASIRIEEEKEIKKIEEKELLNRSKFFKDIPEYVTNGSWQQKKLGTESSYKKRFIWIDYDTKSIYWAKKDNKADNKSLELNSKVKLENNLDIIIITSPGEPSVDLKVDYPTVWVSALKKVIM